MNRYFNYLVMFCLSLVLVFSSTNKTFAKEEIIEASGSYVMDLRLDETAKTAMARAREEAKRDAVEKAGTFVESYTKMVNLVLDYDEVRTIAAQVVKIIDEKTSQKMVQDNLLEFTVTIKALVDDSNTDFLKNMMTDKQSLEEATRRNNELQKQYDELKQHMENLKNQYNSASEKERKAIKAESARNNTQFNAIEELEKGNVYYLSKDYANALTAYNNALKLNPGLAEAYSNRGMIQNELGQQNAAIQDYTTAIKLKPNFANAYNNRGKAYVAINQYQNALQDLQTAVKLDNNSAAIHNNLGSVYISTNAYNEAVQEFTRAIQLDSNYADAYYNRALAYCYLNQFVDALPDAKRAMDLNPNDPESKKLYNQISSRLGGR